MLRQFTRVRAMSTAAGDALFLGLDSSTQGLKATAISRDFKIQHSFAINYQKDLPHYALVNGVHASAGNVVTQPTLMVRFGRGFILLPWLCTCLPLSFPHLPHPSFSLDVLLEPPLCTLLRSTWRPWTCCSPR